MIKESDYNLRKNIELIYVDQNKQKIIIEFEKNNYDLLRWRVVDQLQNKIEFSININEVNSKISSKIFIIPSVN